MTDSISRQDAAKAIEGLRFEEVDIDLNKIADALRKKGYARFTIALDDTGGYEANFTKPQQ